MLLMLALPDAHAELNEVGFGVPYALIVALEKGE